MKPENLKMRAPLFLMSFVDREKILPEVAHNQYQWSTILLDCLFEQTTFRKHIILYS